VASTEIDAEKLDVLRQWASGLQGDARVEVAAAGRAVLMLVEEIERLHVHLWDRQLYPEAPRTPDIADSIGVGRHPRLFETLRDQLRRRSAGASPQPESASEDAFHK
jgi:hypothetical protein